MFDRINIKAIILAMAFAAVLSVTIGGLRGVSVGSLIVRGIVFGLIFGIGDIIINLVVSTYLPELVVRNDSELSEDEDVDERGSHVDIVMDDTDNKNNEGLAGQFDQTVPMNEGDSPAVNDLNVPDFQPVTAQTLTEQAETPDLPDIGAFASVDDDDELDSIGSEKATEAPGAEIVKSRFSEMQTNDEDKKEFFKNNTTVEDMAKGVKKMLKSDEKG